MQRIRFALAAGALSFGLVAPLSAQVVVTSSSSGSGGVFMTRGPATLPVSETVLKALVIAHVPGVLQAGAEENYVVLVVDANDQYVSSKASKANTATAGGTAFTFGTNAVGDTVGAARVIVRTHPGDDPAAAGAAMSSAVATAMTFHSEDGATGVMGTDVKMADVATIGLKRFAAGEFGPQQLIVSVIKLK